MTKKNIDYNKKNLRNFERKPKLGNKEFDCRLAGEKRPTY